MREWRKIYGRKYRGTVSEEDWRNWLALNEFLRSWSKDDSRWVPFDQWYPRRKESNANMRQIRELMRGLERPTVRRDLAESAEKLRYARHELEDARRRLDELAEELRDRLAAPSR